MHQEKLFERGGFELWETGKMYIIIEGIDSRDNFR